MNSEDFFALVYPGLFISSILLSIIPAYLASRKNKNFWVWWLGTTSVFALLLLVVIFVQKISWTVYLLGILPTASIFALLPKKMLLPRLVIPKDTLFFLSVLGLVLIIGVIIYFYLLTPYRNSSTVYSKAHFARLATIILIACLGYVLLIYTVLEKRKREIIGAVFFMVLIALPILLKPYRSYKLVSSLNSILPFAFLISYQITDFIEMPIAGIFVLFGICSGCVAIAIVANDKFHIAEKLGTFVSFLDQLDPPYIPLPQTRILSKIFLGAIVAWALLLHFIGPFVNEGWVFFPPLWLPLLCMAGPISIFPILGFIFSSVVICLSWLQRKYLFAIGIPACGLLAAWSQLRIPLYGNSNAGITYAVTTGFISLILWVFSDHRAQN